eukprot:6216483-Alexandrium_andersonii.AAC.1
MLRKRVTAVRIAERGLWIVGACRFKSAGCDLWVGGCVAMRSGLWSAECCGLGLRMAKRGARRKLNTDGGGMGRHANDELQIKACGYGLVADGGLRRNPNIGLMGSPYRLLIVCGKTRIALGCCVRIADC